MPIHSRRPRWQRRERYTRDGAVLITPAQLALLQGLVDRPNYRAHSCRDWVDASVPYLWRFQNPYYSCFVKCAARVPRAWVERTPSRGWIQCSLTDRGRDILELRVRAHLQGIGPYRGLRNVP